MKGLAKRLDALEVGTAGLSPACKAWLGQPLTAAEQEALDAERGAGADRAPIDRTGWSRELKAWLGVE